MTLWQLDLQEFEVPIYQMTTEQSAISIKTQVFEVDGRHILIWAMQST